MGKRTYNEVKSEIIIFIKKIITNYKLNHNTIKKTYIPKIALVDKNIHYIPNETITYDIDGVFGVIFKEEILDSFNGIFRLIYVYTSFKKINSKTVYVTINKKTINIKKS